MDRLLILTYFPSPHQVEFFDVVAKSANFELEVLYRMSRDEQRLWMRRPLRHSAQFLDSNECRIDLVERRVADADFVVFGHYSDRLSRKLIGIRVASGNAWSFWGERPGYRMRGLAGSLVRRLRMRWLHAADASIWGVGEFGVAGYRQEFGGNRMYRNLPYFSDLSRFSAVRRMRAESATQRVILFSGSLIPRKGVDLVARAFTSIASRFPEVRLRIAGEGPLRDSIASTLSRFRDRVDFLGFKDWDELPEAYRGADILCVPSRYDGWGLVVQEGLAAGLPTISTTRMGAGVEFIREGKNGWLVPPGDLDALISAMTCACMLSTDELAAMREDAVSSVAEHTPENGAMRLCTAFRGDSARWR